MALSLLRLIQFIIMICMKSFVLLSKSWWFSIVSLRRRISVHTHMFTHGCSLSTKVLSLFLCIKQRVLRKDSSHHIYIQKCNVMMMACTNTRCHIISIYYLFANFLLYPKRRKRQTTKVAIVFGKMMRIAMRWENALLLFTKWWEYMREILFASLFVFFVITSKTSERKV